LSSTRLGSFGTWYLPILFTIPAFATYFHSLAPNENIFKGQDWGIWVAFLLTLVATLSWLACRDSTRLVPLARAALTLMLLAWMYQVVRTQLDGSTFNLSAFAVPLAIVLILLKPPRLSEVRLAGLTLAYSLILVSALSLAFGALGVGPDGFAVTDSQAGSPWFFNDWVGLHTRWGGPFGSVNLASPVGGLLVILAFSYKGVHRYLIMCSGLLIFSLSQARSPIIGIVAGLVILTMSSPLVARFKYRIPLRLTTFTGLALGYAGSVLLYDPTFNGRTVIWSNFGNLWLESPLTGVGSSGINNFIAGEAGTPGFVPHNHMHSVLGDILVRFGAPLFILSLGVFIASIVISIRSASRDSGKNLAIVVFVVLAGLTETIHSFNYLSVYLCALLFVVLSSSAILVTAASKTEKHDAPTAQSV
jgi:hypothetical protein